MSKTMKVETATMPSRFLQGGAIGPLTAPFNIFAGGAIGPLTAPFNIFAGEGK